MKLPKKILVPVDFSDRSNEALEYALDLAKVLGAEIVLLHVYEVPVVGFPDGGMLVTAEIAARIMTAATDALASLVESKAKTGVPITSKLEQGDAWRQIIESIGTTGATLVVMATSGRRGLPRALLGSVAEKVVRTSPCPVLTLRDHEADK